MSKNVPNTICVLFTEHEKLNIYSFNTNGIGNTKKKKKEKDLLAFLANKVVISYMLRNMEIRNDSLNGVFVCFRKY